MKAVAGAVLVLLSALLLARLPLPGPFLLVADMGPNDGDYTRGFARHFELGSDHREATRWSGRRASVTFPFDVRGGPVTVAWRLARVLPETATVDVWLAGQRVDHFRCRGGAVVEREVTLAALPATAVDLRFDVEAQDAQQLGLRFDWVRVEAGPGAVLRSRSASRPGLLLALAVVMVAFGLAGAGGRAAVGAGAALVALHAAALSLTPQATAHVAARLALPLAVVALVAAALLRRRAHGGAVLAIVLLGAILKGALLLHPVSWYQDVQQHRRALHALRSQEGSPWARMRAAQQELHWAERTIGGRPFSFPYSPMFYVPFLPLADEPQAAEDAMKQAALAAVALEPALVYLLGALVLGPGGAVAAAVLSAVSPPAWSRLLLAMWPTLAGHVFDLLAIFAALRYVSAPSPARLRLLAAATLAALLAYISGLFTVPLFLAALALLERAHARRLLAVLLGAAVATVLLLYVPFVVDLVTVIAPAMLAGHAPAAAASSTGLVGALARLPSFFGWPALLMAVGGGILVRRAPAPARHVIGAWALAFAVLVLLRAFGGGLFKDLKEITFVAPLVALLAAALVQGVARLSRPAAVLLLAGVVAGNLARVAGMWDEHRTELMRAAWADQPSVR